MYNKYFSLKVCNSVGFVDAYPYETITEITIQNISTAPQIFSCSLAVSLSLSLYSSSHQSRVTIDLFSFFRFLST